jgi:cellulose synthase/poly-beta-1,6-N-acetylglucosamine synthase-like glycosyltransferase
MRLMLENFPIAAIVAAHNEAGTIEQTLLNLTKANPPPSMIVVIADRCTDATAAIARRAGAVACERQAGPVGKGPALHWLFEQQADVLSGCPIVSIFDADTLVHPGFFGEAQRAFRAGAEVVQGFVQPNPVARSISSRLAAYSELLAQIIDNRVALKLGWSVPLKGTGMAFRTPILRAVLPETQSMAEDIELTLCLADRGHKIAYMETAIIVDPKPSGAVLLARQRARWLRGQGQVWQAHAPRLLRLMRRGPEMWWLVGTMMLKPKTLWVTLKVLLLALSFVFQWPIVLQGICGGLVLLDAAYYLLGLGRLPAQDRASYARALALAPFYPVMWLISLIISLRAGPGWLRVR